MALTYTAIATVTISSATAASIDFQNIPATYTDLLVSVSARNDSASVNPGLVLKLNNSSANFSGRNIYGNGSSAASYTDTSGEIGVLAGGNATASTFGNAQIYIPNYTSSNNKSISTDSVNENNATSATQFLYANLWSNSAAIDRITLSPGAGNLVQYSTATLYGIKNTV